MNTGRCFVRAQLLALVCSYYASVFFLHLKYFCALVQQRKIISEKKTLITT